MKTKLRTNSKEVREKVRQHILERVLNEYGEPFPSLEAACHELLAEFEMVAGHPYDVRRIPNNQERFRDWMTGRPFSFEYTHHGIAEFLNGLGINPEGKEYDSEKSSILYHYLIYSEALKATS
jgi:hypothetical protein